MPKALQPIIDESCAWLTHEQEGPGGWGERKGSNSNALNTAEVILGLLDSASQPPTDVLQRGTQYLIDHHRIRDGVDSGAWTRQVHQDSSILEIPDIIRTCFALQALARTRFDPVGRGAIDEGVKWLLGRQQQDGSWGFSRKSASAFMPTCLSLLTLVICCGEGVCAYGPDIQRGFKFMQENFHNDDGSFGRYPYLVLPHTIYAVTFLKAALTIKELGSYLNPNDLRTLLEKATNWLIDNSALANRATEETFRIDPAGGIGNYRFRYMADALLVRALEGSADPRVAAIAETMTSSIDARKSAEGGFYGDRMSTWATAKVLSGLAVAKTMPPSLKRRRHNEWITATALGIVVLMILSTVYLASVDKLSIELFSLFSMFGITVLLLADKLTGGEFMTIFREILHLPQPPTSVPGRR